MKYQLFDTFNGQVISRHRTPQAAGKAARKHAAAVHRYNGSGSYIPVVLLRQNEAGEFVRLDQDTDTDDYIRALNE